MTKKRLFFRGFTLIELLIACSIIIILAGIVLISVRSSREKAQDAKIKETLNSFRIAAAAQHSDFGSYNTICTMGKPSEVVSGLVNDIQPTKSVECVSDDRNYMIAFPLKHASGYWCVDADGASVAISDVEMAKSAKRCDGLSYSGNENPPAGGGGGEEPTTPPPSLTVSAGPDQIITLPTNSVTISGSANGGTDPMSYIWTKESGGAATIASPNALQSTVTGLVKGTYVFKLTTVDNASQTASDTVRIIVNEAAGGAFGGVVQVIPGKIQVEDFNTGGQNVAYYDDTNGNSGGRYRTTESVDIETTQDTGGGYSIGWANQGEWLKYSVNVQKSGVYTIQARIASPGTGTLQIDFDGEKVAMLPVQSTGGWGTWQNTVINASTTVHFSAGQHIMRLYFAKNSSNINYLTFNLLAEDGSGDIPASRTLDTRGPVVVSAIGPYTSFNYYESLPRGYYNDPEKKWPLLIFMHGVGEKPPEPITSLLKYGPTYWINKGEQLEFNINGTTESFVVMAPQSGVWPDWHPYVVDSAIEYAKSAYNIDPDRVYITGLSSGSWGTLMYPAFSPEYSNAFSQKVAAIAPVSGIFANDVETHISTANDPNGDAPLDFCYIPSAAIPVWLFNATGHGPEWMVKVKNILLACNPYQNPAPKYTMYEDQSTPWDRAYDPSHTYENPNLYEWFLMQHR